MPYILQTHQLTKSIGGKDLVTNVDIHMNKGEIYGFLGPNGAGKTTIMKMITNIWKPSSGSIEVLGEELTPSSYEMLKHIGSIIEFPTFFDNLSAKENLKLHCDYMGYYNSDSIDETLHLLSIDNTGDKPVKSFSLGMKQRLGIARAVLTKPELLILDEPTNGLDPAGMKQIRDLMNMLCQEYGMSIMISSHILSEVASVADTIGIIHQGKMRKEISMKEISESNLAFIELKARDIKKACYILEQMNLKNFKIVDDITIRIYDMDTTTQDIIKAFNVNEAEMMAIGKKSETLEDYFLKLTMEVENQ